MVIESVFDMIKQVLFFDFLPPNGITPFLLFMVLVAVLIFKMLISVISGGDDK